MSKKESLSRKLTLGVFYLLSSSFTSLFLNVITIGLIARALGVENFGLYSVILSFVQLFQFLCDFGLNKTLLKFGSTDITKTQISFGNALFVKSVLILPVLALITFLGFLAGYRNEQIIILELFSLSLILDSFGTVFSSIRRILGSFKLISFFRVLKTLINLIIVATVLSINKSVVFLALANTLLSLTIFIASLLNTLFLIRPKLRLRLISDFFKDSIIFSFNDFFLNIYSRISVVLLSFFNDLHSVGIFSAAVRFTRIANLLPAQVKFALLPTMYRILEDSNQKNDKEGKAKKVFAMLLKYMGIFAAPAALSIFFFSEHIIQLIFSKKYDQAIPLVRLFSFFIYLRFIETPFSLFFIAMSKHKNMVYLQGLTSGLNIILNLALIPCYSAYGACTSTLVSEGFFAVMLITMGAKYLIWNVQNAFVLLIKPFIACSISLIIISLLFFWSNVLFQIPLMLLIYFALLFYTKTFNKQDKEFFLKIFKKNVESN